MRRIRRSACSRLRSIIPTSSEAVVQLACLSVFQSTLECCNTGHIGGVVQVFKFFAPLHLLHQKLGIVHRCFQRQRRHP
jgi:hypothetical protein